ncbi:MAG: hypothetical protein OXI87_16040 [Albidovulum sp.]|nr:hypothetical protein [Albidovulum sp.]MDE0306368.1 hypothetical protein [Albidovulum sp.]MDE0532178.1 hypothetical protein [Albidovulum sp.]
MTSPTKGWFLASSGVASAFLGAGGARDNLQNLMARDQIAADQELSCELDARIEQR